MTRFDLPLSQTMVALHNMPYNTNPLKQKGSSLSFLEEKLKTLYDGLLRLSFLGETLNGFAGFVWRDAEIVQQGIETTAIRLEQLRAKPEDYQNLNTSESLDLLSSYNYPQAIDLFERLMGQFFVFEEQHLESLRERTGENDWVSKQRVIFTDNLSLKGPQSLSITLRNLYEQGNYHYVQGLHQALTQLSTSTLMPHHVFVTHDEYQFLSNSISTEVQRKASKSKKEKTKGKYFKGRDSNFSTNPRNYSSKLKK